MRKLLTIDDFVGQANHVADLKIQIHRAWDNQEAIGHIAFYGPPGLGKTTLARLVANEVGAVLYEVAGRQLSKKTELEDIIFTLNKGDIIFVDEAHSLRRAVVEMLYSPMQDFKFGSFDVNPFTLILATTHMGALPKPLRDRVIHDYEFTLYDKQDIIQILMNTGEVTPEVADFIATRSKGVPRHAVNFLVKVKGYQHNSKDDTLQLKHCEEAFKALDIDEKGLNRRDRLLLRYLKDENAIDKSRAIGQEAICKALNIEVADYLQMIEPHLLREGLISRTGKGRIITPGGYKIVKG